MSKCSERPESAALPAKKRSRGRPIEITPDLIVRAGQLARETLYVECIAGLLGISRSTLYRWLRRGQREQRRRERGLVHKVAEQPYLDFSDSVQKGLAESERADVEAIKAAAAAGAWQAAAWRLERTHPERWSQHRDELRRLRKLVRRIAEKADVDLDEDGDHEADT